MTSLTSSIENIIFNNRRFIISLFLIITIVMSYFASQIKPDAGFTKWLPLKHEYMQTFLKFQKEFGGTNRVMVALMQKEGDIFNPEFFNALKNITDDVFFIPGVDRSSIKSLFTPNVLFIEVVEGGFAGGNIIPRDFQLTIDSFNEVHKNILKSAYIGRLVTEDFKGALVRARLQETDPATGKRLDYYKVAEQLEQIRKKYQSKNIDIHIIGFAKVVGDIIIGVKEIIGFFFIAIIITAVLIFLYSRVFILSILPLICSLAAVIWQLGLLHLMGFGIDPMSVLVPFLVFAIGISHGVQMINSMKIEHDLGADKIDAARDTFRTLFVPGGIALLSDSIGFLAVLLIDIDIIQEMAIAASVGVGVIILTNLFLLPILMSYVHVDKGIILKHDKFLEFISRFAERRTALLTIFCATALLVYGVLEGSKLQIGDLQAGASELREDSRFNRDIEVITNNFSIGINVFSVIAETKPGGCVDYDVMEIIDRFGWQISNVEGVQSVISLASVAKTLNAGWNEGNPKWKVLPRNQHALAQSVGAVNTSSGLLNYDCSVMPILIFTRDHMAKTLTEVLKAVKDFIKENRSEKITMSLATGNTGVMAATNEVVEAAQLPMLLYVYAAISALCLITFRSLKAAFCIIIPPALVSVLSFALMAKLNIGLKVATLPVVAFGVGIGVDYGVYIFNRIQIYLKENMSLKQAYLITLQKTGNAVLFTALTLAVGVSTWIFSDLKFQADMGILLTFMFLVNMLGAVFLLPALAAWLYSPKDSEPNQE